ncbi:MAG: hypothetical protein ACI8U3_000961 [Brevundimonas sp.]|jgi:hypothetical protein
MPYTDLTLHALERLSRGREAVRDLAPALSTFRIRPEDWASEGAAQPLLADVGRSAGSGRSLYLLQVSDADIPSTSLSELRDCFSEAKNRWAGLLKFPRLNKVEPSRVLYVGSSLTLRSRIKEHLGYGADQTFALRLNRWAPAFELDLLVASYDPSSPDEAVLFLEDTLWRRVTPMFGRPGSAR